MGHQECTSQTIADEILRSRMCMNDTLKTGNLSAKCKELCVSDSHAFVSFLEDAPAHGDFPHYISNKLDSNEFDANTVVGSRVHPVTGERVYARAENFRDTPLSQECKYQTLMVLKGDRWNSMSESDRAELLSKQQVLTTARPPNETMRAAGMRVVKEMQAPDAVADKDEDMECMGPTGFVRALGVQFHDDHYCVNGGASRATTVIKAICNQRGVKAGVLVVPHGKCKHTIHTDTLEQVVSDLFPVYAQHNPVSALREAQCDNVNCCDLMARFPSTSEACSSFVPVPMLDLQLGDDKWTNKDTKAMYDASCGGWILRRKIK